LKKDEDIRRALEQTATNKEIKKASSKPSRTFWLVVYLPVLAGFIILYNLFRTGVFGESERLIPLLQRLMLGAVWATLVLMVAKSIKLYIIAPLATPVARYNLRRIINLIVWIIIFFLLLTILFADWYTAVVSFGLISLILGFALQTPITSFIGWIYILIKEPYRVGDRIKIGEETGDIIDVSYLDTTLWEFGGELLSTGNHPSGRIIKFPNSKVLSTPVYNYSWSLFPYVWNDIKLQVAYQSDLEFVARTMREVAAEEVGEAMMERVRTFRELLAQTPVNQVEVQEYPTVVFRVGDNTWIEAICRYIVEPRRAGAVKTRLIKKMLERLNAEPEKAMFPKADLR
jgi:small-conductance mechanosensitive channel